jgi:hypothetical protein
MPVNDLAASATYGPLVPQQLLAGEGPVITDSAPALDTMAKYSLGALTATGVTPWITGTHTAAQAVLVLQPTASGSTCQYAHTGIFNDALITWPAGAAIDSYAKRRAFFTGTFRVKQLGQGYGA